MMYQPEMPGEAVDPDLRRFIPGLGLTKCNILPHYQAVKDDYVDGMRLYEDIIYGDSYGKEFLLLTDGSYLVIKGGREFVFGEAYKVADAKLEQVCQTDKMIVWKEAL
jgi:dipeptidase E